MMSSCEVYRSCSVYWQVLEVMLEEEMDKERWKIPKEEEQEEFWGFEDLEHECDSSSSISPQDSISTRSTMTIID